MKNKIFYPTILLLFIVLVGTLYSCGPSKEEIEAMEKAKFEAQRKTPSGAYTLQESEVTVYEFRGCQYMVMNSGYQEAWGSHMGDCDNPIHKKAE